MDLKLYDTLTREKRPFVPLDPMRVRMYVCGPTVYDFAHIGNARPVIVFDVLFRLLRHLYGPEHVTYVRNITDVDDKINARAAERIAARGETGADLNAEIRTITEETYRDFQADVAALGCLPPTFEPRATEYVSRADGKDMITLIETLIRNGNAYEAEGHVLFDVSSMPDYGALSKRPLDEMIAGARVEVAPYKRSAMDFVLWKPSAPGEPGWESQWGRGRPGWHIECSAMSAALLGQEFDIHGGGVDLVFPHHENEIAQSRCAFHTPFMAKTWMHNGFLQVEGEKMSKSLGNFVTIRELLASNEFGGKDWSGSTIRLAMLKTHFRQPLDWTIQRLWEAEDQIVQWSFVINDIIEPLNTPELRQTLDGPDSQVVEALSDDLNTHRALAAISRLAKETRANPEKLSTFISSLNLMGLLPERPANLDLDNEERRDLFEKIDSLIEARNTARKAKNFAESDRIRDELVAMGIVLKDSKDGTTWELAR